MKIKNRILTSILVLFLCLVNSIGFSQGNGLNPTPLMQDLLNTNYTVLQLQSTVIGSGLNGALLAPNSVPLAALDSSAVTGYDPIFFKTNIVGGYQVLTFIPPSITSNLTANVNVLTNNGRFSVKAFGAKGDGVTDDSDAIQLAINWLQPGYNGSLTTEPVLFFPAGHYKIGKTIYFLGTPQNPSANDPYALGAGVHLQGAGEGYTVLDFATTFTGIGFAVTNNPIHGITISDMKLVGPIANYPPATGTQNSVGIMFGQPPDPGTHNFPTIGRHLNLDHVLMYGWGNAVESYNNWGVQISKCFFTSNLVNDVYFMGTHSTTIKDSTFSGGGFNQVWFAGTAIGFHNPPNTGPGDNANIINCTINGYTNGIYNDELQLNTIGNNIENNGCEVVIAGTLGMWASMGDYILDYSGQATTPYTGAILFSGVAASKSTIINPNFDLESGRRAFNVTNSGSTIILPAVAGTALSGWYNTNVSVTAESYDTKKLGIFNVKDYGAVGDGVTDDAPAVRSCLAACNSAGGGTVFFPAGTYYLNSDDTTPENADGYYAICLLKSNTHITGASEGSSVVVVGNSLAANNGTLFATDYYRTNIYIQNLTINGNKVGRGLVTNVYSTDNLIDLRYTANCYMSDLSLYDGAHGAIDLAFGTNNICERCYVTNCNGSAFTCTGYNMTVRDCAAAGCGFPQGNYETDRHWGGGVMVSYSAQNVLVDHFDSISNYCGVQCEQCDGLTVQNSRFYQYNTNYCINVWLPASGAGIGNSKHITIANNMLYKGSSSLYGMQIQLPISDATITGNHFNRCSLVMTNTLYATVTGNYWENGQDLNKAIYLTGSTRANVCGNDFTWDGDICITIQSPFNSIVGNILKGNAGLALESMNCYSNMIVGNTINAATTYAVYLSGPTNVFIGNNFGSKPLRFVNGGLGGVPNGNYIIGNFGGSAPLRSNTDAGTVWVNNYMPGDNASYDTWLMNGNSTVSAITNNGVVWVSASGSPAGTWPIGSRYSRTDTGDEYLYKSDNTWHVVTAP